MKKRNKILALILAATLSFSFTACGSQSTDGGNVQQDAGTSGGEASDEGGASDEKSAADILAAAQENMKNVKSMTAKMVMEMDMDMEANGEKQSMQTVTNTDMTCFYDPVKLKMDVSMDMGEVGSTSSTIYADMDDEGNYTLYMSDGTNWQSQSAQLADLNQYDAASNMESYLDDSYNFKLDGTEQVDGKNAYKLAGTITGDNMKETMLSSGALDSLSSRGIDSSQMESMVDGLGDIPITIWIDEETSYAVKYDMDMSAVMSALMPKVIESMGDQAAGLTMDIPKMTLQMTCSDYNAAEDFEIPEEAKNA